MFGCVAACLSCACECIMREEDEKKGKTESRIKIWMFGVHAGMRA